MTMTVDIISDALNVKSQQKYITCYLELHVGNVNNIDVTTLQLLDNSGQRINTLETPMEIGDYDSDCVPDLMVKFLIEYDLDDLFFSGDDITLEVRGKLLDETTINGEDFIRIF